jgi:hypothetical protein
MPCNSDYLDPTQTEVEASKVAALLQEIKTGELPVWFGNGHHPSVYNKATKDDLDRMVQELCHKLSKEDVSLFSLEMQMWWREHKRADLRRVLKEKRSVVEWYKRRCADAIAEYSNLQKVTDKELAYLSELVQLTVKHLNEQYSLDTSLPDHEEWLLFTEEDRKYFAEILEMYKPK